MEPGRLSAWVLVADRPMRLDEWQVAGAVEDEAAGLASLRSKPALHPPLQKAMLGFA
jgi:hypothetical protein